MYRIRVTSQVSLDSIQFQEETSLTFLNPVFSGSENVFNASFIFEENVGEEWLPSSNVDIINHTINEGYTLTKTSPNTYSISGKANVSFPGEEFKFLMEDLKTIKILPSTTKEKYSELISWTPPTQVFSNFVYQISYSILGNKYQDQLTQEIYWRYQPSLNIFRKLLSKEGI